MLHGVWTKRSLRLSKSTLNEMHSHRIGNPKNMKAHVHDNGQLQSIVMKPVEKHVGTVIFLHGLGDTGHGWASAVPHYLRPYTPHVKYIFPTAKTIPVTLNGGMLMPAWYDILGLSDTTRVDLAGLEETREKITELIEDEIKSGTPSNKIILGGFSQGGATALFVGYSYPRPLAGIIGLSCYLPNYKTIKTDLSEANKQTEFLMCHGELDDVVSPNWGRTSSETLKQAGIIGKFNTYPNLGHSSDGDVLKDVSLFISKKLKPNQSKL